MRVLLIARPGTGGAARVLEALLRRLPERGIRGTAALSSLEGTEVLDAARAHGWDTVRLDMERSPSWSDLAARREIARLAPGHDVIHAHAAKAGALARLAAGGVPVVYAPHGLYFTYHAPGSIRHRVWRAIERRLASRTAIFHCVSPTEADTCVEAGLCDRSRAVVVPNPVPHLPAVRAPEVMAGDDGPIVLMAARFADPKDPITFLRAAARVDPSLRARFVLVGTGPDEKIVRQWAERPSGGRCWVLTPLPEVRTLLARTRVAVLSSRSEAMPLFLLEALAEGVPAVASDLPGCRDASGDAALYVPPGDPEAMAASIERLLRDAALHADLSAKARARAPQFDEERWLDGIVAMYEKAKVPAAP
ncbi:MAG: glycosyltransferase family 4 protein [Planctomycetes bacterium]|nr:glycosyltransferase family 4 protein [Planctomycetota bacterium]